MIDDDDDDDDDDDNRDRDYLYPSYHPDFDEVVDEAEDRSQRERHGEHGHVSELNQQFHPIHR